MKSSTTVDALDALACDARLAVFRLLLKRGPTGYTPTELARRLEVPAHALSLRLMELARAGLVIGQERALQRELGAHARSGELPDRRVLQPGRRRCELPAGYGGATPELPSGARCSRPAQAPEKGSRTGSFALDRRHQPQGRPERNRRRWADAVEAPLGRACRHRTLRVGRLRCHERRLRR